MSGQLLTVAEVADRLRCSQRTVGDRIRSGSLPASKYAHRWVVEEDDLAAFIAAHRNVPVEPTRRRRRRRAA